MITSDLTIGGVRIDLVSLTEAVDLVTSREMRGHVHLCNAYTLALAHERPDVAASLASAQLNLPDGAPLVWVGRRRGAPRAERVYGPDLMREVLDRGRAVGLRHYLFGSTPDVLSALEARILRTWPGAIVVGSEAPPFRDLEDDELRSTIDRAAGLNADIVWVGLGTPKQDLVVRRMADLGDGLYIAVGAAFDFLSGNKRQAPVPIQRAGLEWVFRLATEPRRLAQRYTVYNYRFLRLLWQRRHVDSSRQG